MTVDHTLNPKEMRKQKNGFLQEIATYRPDLYRFCRRLTNNPLDAEDLVQETLVAAFGKLDNVRKRASPKGLPTRPLCVMRFRSWK